MKLSEAIRLGAMLRPQAFGDFSVDGGSCAMGAALDAVGELRAVAGTMGLGYTRMSELWPFTNVPVVHPILGDNERVSVAIEELNDKAKWTRERIADWVETIEAQQAPIVQTVHCCVPTCRAVMVDGNSEHVSHGLCQRCVAIEMAKLDAELLAAV